MSIFGFALVLTFGTLLVYQIFCWVWGRPLVNHKLFGTKKPVQKKRPECGDKIYYHGFEGVEWTSVLAINRDKKKFQTDIAGEELKLSDLDWDVKLQAWFYSKSNSIKKQEIRRNWKKFADENWEVSS